MSASRGNRNPIGRFTTSIRRLRQNHQIRHRPTGFGFAFADRISFLDPARWEAVVAGQSVFLRREVLEVIENHGPENIVPRYAMVFQDGRPVAVLAAQVVTVTGRQIRRNEAAGEPAGNRPLLKRVFSPAARAATQKLRERMLVAGNLMSSGFHGIAFAPEADPAEIWPGVAEALYRIRRSERLGGETNLIMLKDFTDRQSGVDALRAFSYRPMETEPNMVLAIDPSWQTYEDYLAALDAKYRRSARDQLKKLATAGCVVEPLDCLADHAGRLHELYLAVHQKASVRLVTLGPSFIPALALAAGADFRCNVVRRGDDLLGFITALRDGDTAIAYYVGFDREAAAAGLPVYLRLLHATIGDAVQWKCRRLSLGRTALEPKSGLGARPEPMRVWMRHRVPGINLILRGVMNAVPHAEAPERNPFKERPPVA